MPYIKKTKTNVSLSSECTVGRHIKQNVRAKEIYF